MKNYVIQDNMIKDLQHLIAIKSISGAAQGEYPFGKGPHDALLSCLELCESFGFTTKKCGNYLGYAEIGHGDRLMGILAHVDVVPAGEGWNTDPYQATVIDHKIFGRGVVDDKGPAIAAIYAMKDILSSGQILDKRVRIIFGCSEEVGDWSDMTYYTETEEIPDFGFTPDADFPLIYAEKGTALLELRMNKSEAGLTSAFGGQAHNIVPDTCKITYLNDLGQEVTIIKKGESAHGSTPEVGINAIGLAMKDVPGKFAEFYNSCIGETVDGGLMNCKLEDAESGCLTVNPGIIASDDDFVRLCLDIRYPISYTQNDVVDRIVAAVSPFDISVHILGGKRPVYTDKSSPFIKCLMESYQEVSGDMDSVPMTMGGGTYAKAMANIVAFGPVFPGRECTEHQPNEYIFVEDLYKAREIYRLAIQRS